MLATIYLVMNCQYQFQAELLGNPRYFTDEDEVAATLAEAVISPSVVERVWEYFTRQLPDDR